MIPIPYKQPLSASQGQELLSLQCHSRLALYPASTPLSCWSKTVSSLSNTNGGEIYLGIDPSDPQGPCFSLFPTEESLVPVLKALRELLPLSHLYSLTLYAPEGEKGFLLHIFLCPSRGLLDAEDGKVYFRSDTQDIPCDDPQSLRDLGRRKGIVSYEDELSPYTLEDLLPSQTLQDFLSQLQPPRDPYDFFRSHCLMNSYTQLRNAAVLLFADEPQAMLPHRCGIRILRYHSDEYKENRDDFSEEASILLEGPLYKLIPKAVQTIRQILSEGEIIGPQGASPVDYPQTALHELITNAVLHRDYSIAADMQIRIFTNRLEIESPGSLLVRGFDLPRGCQQRVRNPRLVSLMSKFPQAPNHDLGRGLRQAFRAMRDAGLQSPNIRQGEDSVIHILRHERLADAQSLVLDYLTRHSSINNSIARELTGISDANKMKGVFIQLKEKGLLEIVPGTRSTSTLWRKVSDTEAEEIDQISLF